MSEIETDLGSAGSLLSTCFEYKFTLNDENWAKITLDYSSVHRFDDAMNLNSAPEKAVIAAVSAALPIWRAHPRAKKLAVAFSGGLDSTVLLHALTQLGTFDIEAIHVEHRLQPESASWATHCIQVAKQLGVHATHLTVKVKNVGNGIEDAARRARYQAIAAHTGPNVLLLTAHHQADQAETVLMKLLSGAGPRGVAGMQAFSERSEFLLARPLLKITKAQIVAYAKHYGLRWIEDPSNQSLQFRRNHIRQLMPAIAAIYPDAQLTLSKYAELAGNDRSLLERQARHALARCQSLDSAVLRLATLHAEPAALQPWIVRAWLAEMGVHSPALVNASMALANTTAAFGEVKTRARKAELEMSNSASDWVRRYDNCLYYSLEDNTEVATARIAPTRWFARSPLSLGKLGTLEFDARSAEISESSWIVSQRRGGERIQLPARQQHGKSHRHALKDILQQLRVPPWQRNRLIILIFADTDEVACVVGICASARFQDWLVKNSTRLVHNN